MAPIALHAADDAVQGLADGIILAELIRGLVPHLKKEMEGAAVLIPLFDLLVQKLGEIRGKHPDAEQGEHESQKSGHGQEQLVCKSHLSGILPLFRELLLTLHPVSHLIDRRDFAVPVQLLLQPLDVQVHCPALAHVLPAPDGLVDRLPVQGDIAVPG